MRVVIIARTICSVILLMIFCILICCAQPTDEELIYKVYKTVNTWENYNAEIEVIIRTNESIDRYVMAQWYDVSGKYRLEIIQPENLKGKTTISNGKKVWVFHPAIGDSLEFNSFEDMQEKRMFIGSFLECFYNNKEIKTSIILQESEKYVVLSTEIPGDNKNFNKQKLWVRVKDMSPHKLEINNRDDSPIITVLFKTFQSNIKLDNELFNGESFSLNKDIDSIKPMSILEIENIADFSVILPEFIPEGYELGIINCIKENNGIMVILNYNTKGEGEAFSISQSKRSESIDKEMLEEEETAMVSSIVQRPFMNKVAWEHEGLLFEIIGNSQRHDLMRIAESIH